MARIITIKRARASKNPRPCVICHHEVQPGESYRYIDKKTGPRSGYRLNFCFKHDPRPSHRLSGRAAELQQIIEDAEDALAAPETVKDVADALRNAAEEAEMLADDIRTSAQSIEDGFGHETPQTESMNEAAENIDEWVEKLRDVAQEIHDEDNQDDEEAEAENQDQQRENPTTLKSLEEASNEATEILSDEPEMDLAT